MAVLDLFRPLAKAKDAARPAEPLQAPKQRALRTSGARARPTLAPGGTPVGLRWGVWAFLPAVLGLLAALLVWAPARWLAAPVAHWSGGRVQLMNVYGSVWDGQAQVVLTGGPDSQDRTALPSPVRWQIKARWFSPLPAPGLGTASPSAGRPAGDPTDSGTAQEARPLLGPDLSGPGWSLHLQADCCMNPPLEVQLRPRWAALDVWLPPHRSQWPAALLMGLGTPWNTLQLQAGLHLDVEGWHLRLQPGQAVLDGRIHLDVTDAASQLSTLKPLGSYRLTWQADAHDTANPGAPTLGLELLTRTGALQLQGRGEWVAGRLRFRGEAQASPGSEDALANLMNLLGRRQADRTLIAIG